MYGYWHSIAVLDKVNIYAVILLGLIALATVSIMRTLNQESTLLAQQWQAHQLKVQNNLHRLSLIEEIREHLGYGGVIHHFKNYILRREELYLTHFDDSYDLLLAALESYQALPDLSHEEAVWLEEVKRVIGAYDKIRFFILEMMVIQGKTSEEIDAAVKIDDSPLLNAVKSLETYITLEFEDIIRQEQQKTKHVLQKNREFILISMLVLLVISFFLVVLMARHLRGAK